MDKVKELLVIYIEKVVHNPDYSVSQQIGGLKDLPRKDVVYMQMLKQTYILITTCEKSVMAKSGIRFLLEVKRYHKRNIDFGFQATLPVFSTCLYIIQLYLVRILRHPWKKDFWKIKTYNGAFKHIISENLAPSIYKELMQAIGYQLSQDRKYFLMSKTLNKATRGEFELLAMDLFLAHGYCRMQGEPNLLLELQGKRPAKSEPNIGNPKHTISKEPLNSHPNHVKDNNRYATNARTNALRQSDARYSSLPSRYQGQDINKRNVPAGASRHGSFNERPTTSSNFPQDSVIIDSNYQEKPSTSSTYPPDGSVIIGQYSESPRKNDGTRARKKYTRQNSSDSDDIMESSDRDSLRGQIYYPPKHDLQTAYEPRGKPDGSIEETYSSDPYDFNNAVNNRTSERYRNDTQAASWEQTRNRRR